MRTIVEQLPAEARAAIIRLRSLGDCVLTTPALEILKSSRPDLKLAVVVEPRFAPVFEDNPDVDAILEPSLAAIRAWKPRLCLNLHGGTRSMALTACSGARFRAGFAHHRYSGFYDVRIPTAQEILGVNRKVHTAEHLASAMFYLGAARRDIPAAKLFTRNPPSARPRFAVIHPTAATPEKTWPAAGFTAAAERLERWGLEPVFIGGPSDDLSPFSRWRTLAGRPLAEIKALLSCAAIFVGNDSGPAHMAAAFRVPTAVIFGASDPEVWAPWRTTSQVIHARGAIASAPVADVLAALERLKAAA